MSKLCIEIHQNSTFILSFLLGFWQLLFSLERLSIRCYCSVLWAVVPRKLQRLPW